MRSLLYRPQRILPRILFLSLSISPLIGAEPYSDEPNCIKAEHKLRLSPDLGTSKKKLVKTLGEPKIKRSLGYDEDDGGRAKLTLFRYDSVDVILIRGAVDEIRFRKIDTGISKIIRIGKTWTEVKTVLGSALNQFGAAPSEELILMPSCNLDEDPADIFVYLTFKSNRLKKIRVAVDRP